LTHGLQNSPDNLAVASPPEALVLFDGCCRLCNRFVDFLIRHDRRRALRYTPLQGVTAKQYLEKPNPDISSIDSVVLAEGKRLYFKSSAALRLFKYLPAPWPLAGILMLLPRFFRDWCYDLLAGNRYRIFGRLDDCRSPAPVERELFLP